eukprot:scaffold103092_cov36-Phaeocystis_antarctica.AAC.2
MPSSLPAVASGDCRLVSSKTCLSCSPRMGELTWLGSGLGLELGFRVRVRFRARARARGIP